MAGQSYQDLIVWQKAMNFVECVYRTTDNWPKNEAYGLTSQVRRASSSIPANIAEGQGRGSRNEFARFLMIANGSLYELETHLLIAQRLGYIAEPDCTALMDRAAEVGRLLHGLLRSLKIAPANDTVRV